MSLFEVNEAATLIQGEAHDDATIIFGAVIDEGIEDEMRITVIATGFGDGQSRAMPEPEQAEARKAATQKQGSLVLGPKEKDKKVIHLGTLVDDEFEGPAWQPDERESHADASQPYDLKEEEVSEDDFDIPTFLRKRMD